MPARLRLSLHHSLFHFTLPLSINHNGDYATKRIHKITGRRGRGLTFGPPPVQLPRRAQGCSLDSQSEPWPMENLVLSGP